MNVAYLIFALIAVAGLLVLDRWLRRDELLPLGVEGRARWTAIVILLGGFGGMQWAVRYYQEETSAWLIWYAAACAQEIESLGHEEIVPGRPVDKARYANLVEAQRRWMAANPEINNVYTLRRISDGSLVLNVAAKTDFDRERWTTVGKPYHGGLGPMIERAMAGEPVVAPPYKNGGGTWVSALVPLRDSKDHVDAVLAMDCAATSWVALERRACFTTIAVAAAALLGVAATVLLRTHRHSLGVIALQRAGLNNLEIEHAAIDEIVNSIDAIVWEWDVTARRFTFVSSHAEAMLGHEVETWLADPDLWRLLLHPDDRWADQHFDQLVEGGRPYALEYRMIARDGATVWIRETGLICRSVGTEGHRLARGCLHDITARVTAEAELRIAHRKVVEQSRRAGMAEVATDVLHNVGNVLNSVNVSGNLIVDRVKHSRVSDFLRVVDLVRQHRERLPDFVAADPRGQILPDLLGALAEQLVAEHHELLREVGQISDRIVHIKEIVSVQQNHARCGGLVEPQEMVVLVEDALKLNDYALSLARVEVFRDYERELPLMMVDSHRVLQILVNLIRNAVDSIEAARPISPRITVGVKLAGDGRTVRVMVIDNGSGVAPEHLERIFSHGFTTKSDGHGFGLHSAANAATELGGRLTVESDGAGHGAAFILELPVTLPKTEDPAFWRAAGDHVAA